MDAFACVGRQVDYRGLKQDGIYGGNMQSADVLVTDGDQRATLAVVRSLGRKDLRVVVGEKRERNLAACSRYCADRLIYPSPTSDPKGFQEFLLDHVMTHSYRLLIPMTDVACMLVAEIAEQIRPTTQVALPDGGTYMFASDKAELIRFAQSNGIPVPDTVFVDGLTLLEEFASKSLYPVVVKSRRSRMRVGNSIVYGRVQYAHSPAELVSKVRQSHQSIPNPLIQERIEGPGKGLFALCLRGEPLALFAHRRLREKPPSGGVSVLRESVPLDENLRACGTKLLRALNWTGVAMVEFKLDQRDNKLKLMEINGRFWGSLQLAVDCGMDFPFWLYQISRDVRPDFPGDYPIGVKSRWLLGDVDNLLTVWSHRRKTLSLPKGCPGRLKSLCNFVRDSCNSSKNEIWDRDDLGPARRELIDYLVSALVTLKGRT
jgi:predicted ATP-grasp superfamily ATP-dependent carboligase